jgi:hypothetical protein
MSARLIIFEGTTVLSCKNTIKKEMVYGLNAIKCCIFERYYRYRMEKNKKDDFENLDKEIAYSRTVKAGKRIYYLDVKRTRNEDLYLSLTESIKKNSGSPENPNVTYEKHKLFLYKEDLSKFTEALIDVIRFMQDNDSIIEDTNLSDTLNEQELIDFDDNEPAIKLNLEDFE